MEAADIAGTALDERVAATCGALNRLFGELVDQIAELLADNLWQIGGITLTRALGAMAHRPVR